mmetsp:Transcript_1258/g.2928  ORF Transcript_1258/g.2928 Transcript_1258/m.2928 type:complete len:253 (+) Transcript_1258:193-951(+)|eukprot:CAMPEP_0197583074 /NCGR_PEP_ID=MMETSP1326-20131121/6108_1 /TAXON_ID=1155430 /ORGANISM="Genus nov. species nov., Strain RCC2288" /LENGTH=252 /DNA_ID=CAMNT_0043147247 /DNA_START=138 /DNA_END=896 /DNA_ORIENTATION=+
MSFTLSSCSVSSPAVGVGARSQFAGARLNARHACAARVAARPQRGGGLRTQANMRPYTVRQGDTLATIASKRGMSVADIRKCNVGRKAAAFDKHDTNWEVKIGETILLPAGKLSARDSEIIGGITKINEPRVYPTRKGETIMDIISGRNITFEEVQKINPGVNLGTFNNGEKLRLPPGKYTTREKEMLQGCGILPPETVNPLSGMVSGRNALYLVLGVVFAGGYAQYYAACMRYQHHNIRLWGNDKPEPKDD